MLTKLRNFSQKDLGVATLHRATINPQRHKYKAAGHIHTGGPISKPLVKIR